MTTADGGPEQPLPILPTDVSEVGMSVVVGLSLPLLTMLVQVIAESEADWNFLNVTIPSRAWVGVARRASEDRLVVSTNTGTAADEPCRGDLHAALLEHGFRHVAADLSYSQRISFETDEAFLATARLVVGTFQHVYGANLKHMLSIELGLQP